MEMKPPPLDDRRQSLLQQKLGQWLTWRIPRVVKTAGPYEMTEFVEFDNARQTLANECAVRLSNYSDDDIMRITVEQKKVRHDALARNTDPICQGWKDFRRYEIEGLGAKVPPWYAAGFGHPRYLADFPYWARIEFLKIPEATCLSLGVDPRHFRGSILEKQARDKPADAHPMLIFFERRSEMVRRKFDPESFDHTVTPDELVEWSRAEGIEVPDQLTKEVGRRGKTKVEIVRTPAGRSPDKRELDTVAQLFVAMAIDTYGYRPGDARSPVPGEIASLAATMGIEISVDTVRKYLKRGARFIPEDWEPGKD